MAGKLLIDAHYSEETRIAILGDDGKLENFEAEHSGKKPIKGNIYLAKVVRIEPAIQAAFIDYGSDKHGFLPLSEIHYDYFNKSIVNPPKDKDEESETPNTNNNENDGAEEQKDKKNRQFKIQEVISAKQVILVQAEKEVRGNKCAFFTTFISIPGRYCVLMPNPPKGKNHGVSKKIEFSEKERLREILDSLEIPEGMGCIVRTAGENKTKQEIKRDLEYLSRLWGELKEKIKSSVAPSLIHEEGNIIKRTIRDLYQKTSENIIVQGMNAYKEARTFMKIFTPSHVKKIELYKDDANPIFHKYEVEDKISKILDPYVDLPSGGSIVINTTEALTAIDVNSGRMKNERDIEGTALRTNLEAASEIARQIKLRDIAGIIVIDFIDMNDHTSVGKVEKKMKESMKGDYSSVQFSKISHFGLMEISRQRLRTSLADSTFVPCKHCGGSGKILANETVALSVIRKIENFLVNEKTKSILAEVADGVDLFILNNKRKLILEMETTYNTSIEISRNPALNQMDCKVIVKEYKPKEFSEERIKKQNNKNQKSQQKPVVEASVDNNSDKLVNKTNIKAQKIQPLKDSEKEQKEQNQQKSKNRNNKFKKPVEEKTEILVTHTEESITSPSPAASLEQIAVKKKRRRKKKPSSAAIAPAIASPNTVEKAVVEEISIIIPEKTEEPSVAPKKKRRKKFKKPVDATGPTTNVKEPQEKVDDNKVVEKSLPQPVIVPQVSQKIEEQPKAEQIKKPNNRRRHPIKNPETDSKQNEPTAVEKPIETDKTPKKKSESKKDGWLKKMFS